MPDSIQVVSRALHILETLARKESPMTLAEIAEVTGLPKSTVHRLLKTLDSDGFAKMEGSGRYAIGRALICLGAKVVRGGLIFQAAGIMTSLRDRTGCTIYLSSINKHELVYLHRVPGAITPVSDAGSSGNIFCSTGGRMILSTYSDARISEIFAHNEIKPRTIRSIKTREDFLKEMEETRHRGYSKSVDEYTIGVSGIGAPIYDYTGECIAALSLVAVVGTITVDVEEYASMLLDAARDISERLAYAG